jgi:hypothetical protein
MVIFVETAVLLTCTKALSLPEWAATLLKISVNPYRHMSRTFSGRAANMSCISVRHTISSGVSGVTGSIFLCSSTVHNWYLARLVREIRFAPTSNLRCLWTAWRLMPNCLVALDTMSLERSSTFLSMKDRTASPLFLVLPAIV